MHLLPFSACSLFLMPSTVSVPRMSLIKETPQFLHPLLLTLRAVKPTDGCHELTVPSAHLEEHGLPQPAA